MSPWPFIVIYAVVAVVVWVAHRLIFPPDKVLPPDRKLPRQLLMAGVTLAAFFVVIIFLPVSDEVEVQILAVVGIALSGVVALASTSVFANAMAGLNIRLNRRFNLGDHVRVDEHVGRVSERGLFDTEIQTIDGELISIPNSYLINTPIVVVAGERTVVSASVRIGGDEDLVSVEELLKHSALDAGLADSFVLIVSLESDHVLYRVSGFLDDESRLIAKRSKLNRSILLNLSEAGIAVSQTAPLLVHRTERPKVAKRRTVLRATGTLEDENIDDLLFEKATKAERAQAVAQRIDELRLELKGLEGGAADRLQSRIDRLQGLLDDSDQV